MDYRINPDYLFIGVIKSIYLQNQVYLHTSTRESFYFQKFMHAVTHTKAFIQQLLGTLLLVYVTLFYICMIFIQ